MTVDEEQVVGEALVTLLHLKKNKAGRYDTCWGDKTPVGLCRTIQRVFDLKGSM